MGGTFRLNFFLRVIRQNATLHHEGGDASTQPKGMSMARDGAGNMSIPNSFTSGNTIASADVNANFTDIATALTASIAKDGQTTPSANLPMGGYKHTNVAAASSRTDYARASQVMDGSLTWPTVGGTGDAITLAHSPAQTAYTTGMVIRFKAGAANTGAVTVNADSLGAKSLKTAAKVALASGDLVLGQVYTAVYDGTDFLLREAATSEAFSITGLTAETAPATDDVVPLYDTSATANRKMTLANVLKVIGSLTAETAPATDDILALYDTSAGTADAITLANLFKVINSLTAETAPATDDVLALYDTSAGTTDSITLANVLKVINSLTEDTSPDTANDFLLSYDTSASAVKKVKPSSLATGGATLIASGSLSGTAVNFTSIPATYAYLVVQITGMSFSAGATPTLRASTNNGASYDSTAANYGGLRTNVDSVPTVTTAQIGVASMLASRTLTGADTCDATITIKPYAGGTWAQWTAVISDSSGNVSTVIGVYKSTSAINALQLAGGTFDAGTYRLDGVS